ncbi:type VI secretion protein [Pseudidiomarina sp. CB1]|uniref:type VI secretion protein n=1 Tax=Pseudidiomarina sp. CB1 TaxID=2972484 RepID=UPI002161E022|nr:type VI secretion protein [Pseudidiomarina sp. CB1]
MLKLLALGSVVSCLSVALLWTPNASAQEPTLEQLRTCAAIENPLKRLVCYDKVAAGEGVEIAVAETNKQAPAKKSNARQEPADDFGLPAQESNEDSDTIYVAIDKTEKDPYGKWIIYFTNGQVWKQTDSQTFQLPLDGNYAIERGLLNGYFLGREGVNKRIKVRRIK